MRIYIFFTRQVGPQKTSSECREHFEKHYIDNWSGELDLSWRRPQVLHEGLRADEPISCSPRTQEVTGAPLGGPVRPWQGSVISKGRLMQLIMIQSES